MNPDEMRLLIEDAVRRAIQPLENEVRALRLEVVKLKNAPATSSAPENAVQNVVSLPPSPTVSSSAPPSEPPPTPETANPDVPAERTDFARFLQRGLEQEAQEYSEERMKDAEPKKKPGWNPFKR